MLKSISNISSLEILTCVCAYRGERTCMRMYKSYIQQFPCASFIPDALLAVSYLTFTTWGDGH